MLATIERMLDDTRRELTNVDTRLERASAELAQVRQAELGVLSVLARLRLREIERGEVVATLDETGRRVTEVLAQRADAQTALGTQIAAAQEALAKLEQERTARSTAVDAAEEAVDAAEADAQQELAADAAYRAVLDKAQASDGVADLAEAKAAEASTDRAEKGKPYEADPLFVYLWSRGYGTSRYRAGPLTRLLDGWVARVGEFEPLRRNYFMLSEMPARFDEHAKRMRALADEDVAQVRSLEQRAAVAAGVPERERALDAAEEALAAMDKQIEERQAELDALVEKRASFASGEDELSRRCAELLSDALAARRCKRCASARTGRTTPPTTRRWTSSP